MFDTSKLKGKIAEVFGTQSEFAKYIKRSKAWVSNVMNGKATLDQADVVLWANALGIDLPELGEYFFTLKTTER